MRKLDLTGRKFGKLTVISQADSHRKPSGQIVSMWNCKCECGKDVIVSVSELRSGGTKSCGCLKHDSFDDLTNKKFGFWTVISKAEAKRTSWLCRCKCGTEKIIRADALKNCKDDSSCGCNLSERIKAQYENGRRTTLIDLIGKKFGRLTVISRENSNDNKTLWKCQCDCGAIVICDGGKLRKGLTRSCGCYAKEIASKTRLIDLTGETFGEWTVIKRANDHITPKGTKIPKWICKCNCGTERKVFGAILRNGNSKSCGCITVSRGEALIANTLNQYHISYQSEYSFPDLLSKTGFPLRFDFCLFDNDKIVALIEYQGEQHYIASKSGFGDIQRLYTDPQKRKYCKTHNLELFEIRYNEDITERLYEILTDLELLHDNSVPSSEMTEKV